MQNLKSGARVVVTPVHEGAPGQFAFSLEGQCGDVTHAIPFACFRDKSQASAWRERVLNWLAELTSREARLETETGAALRSCAAWGLTIVNMLEADAHISAAARKRGEGVSPDDFDALRTRLAACLRAWIIAPARAAAGEVQNAAKADAGRESWDAYMRWLEDGGASQMPHSALCTQNSAAPVSIPPHPPATTKGAARVEMLQRELADVIIDRDVERELRQKYAAELAELREQVRELRERYSGRSEPADMQEHEGQTAGGTPTLPA